MRGLLAALAFVLALLPACLADRTPPANVPCDGESDCAEGFTCRTLLGRCVAIAGLDTEPPAATDVVIAPASATLGNEILLTFSTEPLLSPPVVTADTDDVPFTLVSAGDSWTYSGVVSDTATATGVRRVAADLVDESGNGAHVELGSFVLDLTSPGLRSCTFDPPSITLGADGFMNIELVFDEGSVTVLDFELVSRAGVASVLTPHSDSNQGETQLSAEYTFTGDEAPGTYDVAYAVQDAVGNVADAIGCSIVFN